MCGTKTNLHLHHRTYKRLGRERLNDLVPLCKAHHEQAHQRVRAGARLWNAHTKLDANITVVPTVKPKQKKKAANKKKKHKPRKITFETRTSVCKKCGTTFPAKYPKLRCWCGEFIVYQDSKA